MCTCVCVCVCLCQMGRAETQQKEGSVVGVILCNMEIVSFYQRAFEKLRFLR